MNEIDSLLFYIFSFLLSAFFYHFYNKKNKKIYFLFAFIIPVIIGGLRFNVGTDYPAYYDYYEHEIAVDTGFSVVSNISRRFGDVYTMFFIYNFLTLSFVFLGLRQIDKKYRTLAYICFLFLFYTTSFNAIRQMLAVSIIFFSYQFALEKKLIKFLLAVAAATLFHTSAVISVAIYPLTHIKNLKLKIVIGILALTAILNYQNIIAFITDFDVFKHFTMYENYTDTFEFSNASFYIELLVLTVLLFLRKKGSKIVENYKQYLFIAAIGVLLLLTGFSNPYIKRIALYFTIINIILLSFIPHMFNDSKKRHLVYVLVVAYVIARFVLSAFIMGQSDIIPYNFINI